MKTKLMFFPLMALVLISASAREKGPAPVSPSSVTGIARVGTTCPTFSWTFVEWATGYSIVVFETNGPNVLDYKEMEAISTPVVSNEIKGRALSWTPSSEERLRNGGTYVWYVQALDSYGMGIWSEGRMFNVEAEVQFVGMEDSVRKNLKEKGMNEEEIEDVLENMKLGMREVVAYGIGVEDNKGGTLDKISIQGYESATNTFYGLNAGYTITDLSGTGTYNSFFGTSAGYSNTTGDYNTFIGFQAGYSNTTGNYNTFLGRLTGRSNTNGGYNTFIGNDSGRYNTSGFYNTIIGYSAGYSNTTANRNTFIGYEAGYSNTTGQGNIFLGFKAGYNETSANRLYIDNSDTNSPLIWGDFGNDILAVNGKMCIGTTSSIYAMELETTGENAAFVAQRTDGATNYINATAGFGHFGTVTNHPLRLAVNSVWRMRLDSDNSLTMASGAMCTAGGTWQNYSKREAKENIRELTTQEAMDTLSGLVAVKYNYKVDKEEKHVGFIAEDVPELVASKDRNGISSMDIVAVLTKVVQEQQRLAEEQQKTIVELQKQIDELKSGEK